MSFTEAIRAVVGKYATFTGRACRSEYWWWTLFTILFTTGTGLADSIFFANPEGFRPVSSLASYALIIPSIAVSVRRLHDVGRSGWWLAILLIPFCFLLILYWMLQPSEEGTNAHGEAPLA